MEVFKTSFERNNHLSTAKWFRYGDICFKTFFDFHRIRKKKTLLKELKVDGGTISNQKDLSHYITKFYANLYASKVHALSTFEAQERRCENVPTWVTEAMNADMTRPLSLTEIMEAITSLPKGKAPGHDGIPTKFFQEHVNEIPHATISLQGHVSTRTDLRGEPLAGREAIAPSIIIKKGEV